MRYKKVIILSGGFDPVHIGHLRMFKSAKQQDAIVIAGVNSDAWLSRKKGKPFMIESERMEILDGFKYIDYVYSFDDSDETACDLIRKVIELYKDKEEIKIFFGNGGDRTTDTTPEMEFCKKNGVEMLWGLGGGKIQSSSELIKEANNS
tara:strand:+ start:224 stop:670 length:447 start_codon:yes stop_codon:yes gene_type:complete